MAEIKLTNTTSVNVKKQIITKLSMAIDGMYFSLAFDSRWHLWDACLNWGESHLWSAVQDWQLKPTLFSRHAE